MKTIANGMEFIDDQDVIGKKWEHFSIINSKDEFDPTVHKALTENAFKFIQTG